jgi:hypothetical protein
MGSQVGQLLSKTEIFRYIERLNLKIKVRISGVRIFRFFTSLCRAWNLII